MNAYGLRMQLKKTLETGLPPEPEDLAQIPGQIRFYRWVDNSRKGIPDTHALELEIEWRGVPMDLGSVPYDLTRHVKGGSAFVIDPRKDVWTAPAWVEFLRITTCGDPEQVYTVRPRLPDWEPEPAGQEDA